jgi:hypothetical protein
MGSMAARRLQRVEEHVRLENAHDLDGLMSTFGATGFYADEPWAESHDGLERVRDYYADLLRASPDLHVEVKSRLQSEGDVRVSGTDSAAAWSICVPKRRSREESRPRAGGKSP